MSQDSLTSAAALSIIGGLLTIIIGGVDAAVSIPTGYNGLGSTETGLVAGLAVLAGIILLIFGVGLIWDPESHTGLGVALIVISVLTLWGGFAFIPGVILCVIGGLLAILHEEVEDKAVEQRGLLAATRSPTPQRNCPSCGQPVGLATNNCPECGAQLN